jgi:hypothetical protein
MSVGITHVIADVLRNDVTTVPASTFVSLYPSVFNAASAVPTYLYTCLKDIWLANTTASGNSNTYWSDQIVSTYGYGNSGRRTIDVTFLRTQDGINSPNNQSNTVGAEYAEIFIYFKIGDVLQPGDVDRITNAELRVRRLIDYNYRVNITKTPIFTSDDLTIDPNYPIQPYWQGFIGKDQSPSKECAALYFCTYRRLLY